MLFANHDLDLAQLRQHIITARFVYDFAGTIHFADRWPEVNALICAAFGASDTDKFSIHQFQSLAQSFINNRDEWAEWNTNRQHGDRVPYNLLKPPKE